MDEGFLNRLMITPGLPGHETGVSGIVVEAFQPLADEVWIDRLGNCIALKLGEGGSPRPRVMFAAHMDEVGLIVTKIEEGGFLRFTNMGGIDPKILPGLEVVVYGSESLTGIIGSKPPHIVPADEKSAAPKMKEMYIDVGLSEADVKKVVRVGDMVGYGPRFVKLGDLICGTSLDNRAGVAVLRECLAGLAGKTHSADVYAVATVQEETGSRGSSVCTFCIEPETGIAIDVTHADMTGVPEYETSHMGKGPVLSVGPNVHPEVYRGLRDAAGAAGIPVQVEVLPGSTGTDAWAIQVVRSGVATGVISVPVRYMHTPVEVVTPADIDEAARLAVEYVLRLDAGCVEGFKCYY